ncbi:MAG: MFS transporter [Dehalococcoidia bacterium]|nr:MFS transporter [Dehalococcoidia bacterium]
MTLAKAFLKRIGTFESLTIRDYRLLWFGQCSTSMGQWMDQAARGWLMYSITNSPLQLGLAAAARGVPLIFFSLLAGALADRSGRKAQLIIAQVTNAALAAILATLVLTGDVQPWHIYVTGFIAGSVQAFQQPARQTLIGDIVGDHRLMNALALNSTALNVSRMLGPMVAGLIIALVGAEWSYYWESVMYLTATIWTIQMRVPERRGGPRAPEREPLLGSIQAGFAYVWRERDIRSLMVLGLGPLTFGMAYSTLIPLFAQDILHGGAPLQGTLFSVIGAGSLVGAIAVASIRRTHGYGLPVVIGGACFSVAVFAFASSELVWLSIVLGACIGAANVTYNTQNQTLLQVITPPQLRGRVMSIRMLERGLVPFASLLTGALASAYGGPNALRLMSAVGLAIVVLVVVTTPQILRLKVSFTDVTGSADAAGEGAPARRRAGAAITLE